MKKQLIATQYWQDKDTGEVTTKFSKFTEGTSKEGRPYGLIDNNVFELVNGKYPIGTISNFTVAMDNPAPQSKTVSETRSIKLNSQQISSSTESK